MLTGTRLENMISFFIKIELMHHTTKIIFMKPSTICIQICFGLLLIFSHFGIGQTLPESKKEPIHFAIALAQPEEAQTIAWLNATALWEGASSQGYGFGEWNWPSGALTLALKNPQREVLNFKTQTSSGECYLLGVDSVPNPDPKKIEKYPRITTANCVSIKSPKPGNKSFIYGVSFIRDPLNLDVNGQKLTLKFAEPIQLSTGMAMIKENGEILTSSDPQDPCIIALAFFKSATGKVYVINSRFY
jgi:hypothetical protein